MVNAALGPGNHNTDMHVSAIICTRNRPDSIGDAISSVLANTYPSFDLLIVDQSDDDRTGALVRGLTQTHTNLRYLHTAKAGLSRAYNIGIRESTGNLLAFTDDDCIAPTDWVGTIVEAFAGDPDAELLYGQVLRPASLLLSPDVIPTLAIPERRRYSRRDGFRVYGMGANFAARRQLFERVGWFDEVLGGGGPLKSSQDFDLQYRAYISGATILLSPLVNVDHYGARTFDQWSSTMRAYGIGDGAFYFKHVRCGDMFALWLLIRRLTTMTASFAFHSLRRQPNHAEYLFSCFRGIMMSLQHPVDRRRRIYQT
jgi:glycosyltransferase involved in cell wall biosynthesis